MLAAYCDRCRRSVVRSFVTLVNPAEAAGRNKMTQHCIRHGFGLSRKGRGEFWGSEVWNPHAVSKSPLQVAAKHLRAAIEPGAR